MMEIESPHSSCLPNPHTVAFYKPTPSRALASPFSATSSSLVSLASLAMATPKMPLERAHAVPAPIVYRAPLERAYAVPAPVVAAQWIPLERTYAVAAPLTDADLGFGCGLTALPSFSAWVPERS